MATADRKTQQWHATYWNEQKHGNAWERVKEAMKRDWAQTKEDVGLKSGKKLDQGVDDTVKQAAGKQAIPPPNQPNPSDFDKVEPAVSYGFGAREEYGQKYPTWDESLESRLANEWDQKGTGMTFEDAKPNVRRGWDYRK